MPDGCSHHRLRLIPALIISSVLIAFAACRSRDDAIVPKGGGGGATCAGHDRGTNYAPLICVDDSVTPMTLTPKIPIRVSEQEQDANHKPTGKPNQVRWLLKSSGGNTLQVVSKTGAPAPQQPLEYCVTSISCAGPECRSLTKVKAPQDTQCAYSVVVKDRQGNEVGRIDPIVIVDTCCPPLAPYSDNQ